MFVCVCTCACVEEWTPTHSKSYLSMILQVTDLEHLHHFPDEESEI